MNDLQMNVSQMNAFRQFLKYTSLNICSMLGLSIYILADTFFIANGIGETGLTALNLAIPVYNLVNGTGLMLGIGGATRYTIYRAQKNHEKGKIIFTNMIFSSMFFGFLFAITGIFLYQKIALLLGADDATLEMTSTYIRYIFLFAPAFITNNVVNAFVRNDNAPVLAMTAMLSGSFMNILFDYIFIYPMQLGLFGAVLATGFAPLTGLMVLGSHFYFKKNNFSLVHTFIDLKRIVKTMALGVAAFITELSSGIVIFVYNLLVLRIAGNTGVAAYGIIANIALVILSIFNGISQGIQPVVSYSYGRGDKDTQKKVLTYGILSAVLLSIILYLILFIKADTVSSLFNSEHNQILQEMSNRGIKIYFIGCIFAGINIVLLAYYAAIEQPMKAEIISMLRGIILIIPFVILLSHFLLMDGIWLSFMAAEILTLISGIILRHL